MQYTLEHGDVCLGNDVVGLSKITETLNAQQARIAKLELALEECHDALQNEEHQHAYSDYEFTTHPLLNTNEQ